MNCPGVPVATQWTDETERAGLVQEGETQLAQGTRREQGQERNTRDVRHTRVLQLGHMLSQSTDQPETVE